METNNHIPFAAASIGYFDENHVSHFAAGETETEILRNQLPTDFGACTTDLELAFLLAGPLHSELRRPVEVIQRHLELCYDCRQRFEQESLRLRHDQALFRHMAGAPPFAETEIDSKASESGVKNLSDDSSSRCLLKPGDRDEDGKKLAVHRTGIFSQAGGDATKAVQEDCPAISLSKTKNHQDDMNEHSTNKKLYVHEQTNLEKEEKEIEARWIANDLPLQNGSGLFIDAGSSCFVCWERIAERFNQDHLSFGSVLTSSLLVLQSWAENHASAPSHIPRLQIAGGLFDADHLAFYGADRSRFDGFRPTAVLIGAFGVEFEPGRLWLGYNAGDPERDAKKLLFQCNAKRRIILLTPSKIGNAGGSNLDVLEIEGLDANAPIYLVTTEPPAGTVYRRAFDNAKKIMRSKEMTAKLQSKGLVIHWVTLKKDSGDKIQDDIETFPDGKPQAQG